MYRRLDLETELKYLVSILFGTLKSWMTFTNEEIQSTNNEENEETEFQMTSTWLTSTLV
uniref:Uncharacterized protein n=1 Tax=Arion vulgaris TaxID=1028688 RepID=A0A0B6ZXP9_9EUPU